jgi:sirohydrochlorin cobaltochelatase
MKKSISILLAFLMMLACAVPGFAATDDAAAADFTCVATSQNLTVNGEAKDTEVYNIDGYNYFQLRDIAALLNGTNSQFSVGYDEATRTVSVTTGEAYAPTGDELATGTDKSGTAVKSSQTVMIDGEVADLAAYNLGGNNFFQLRELGKALKFYVHYDAETRTMQVDESDEDEAWDTGDASLDDPRNADGIGETEVLVVSFGTSFNDSRVATIGAIEAAMEKAFPGYSIRRGFTANIIIDHVLKRDDEKIDDITEALDRAVANGVKNLLVQPTHLMNGFEYTDVQEELKKYEDKFETIALGAPILTSDEDYDVVIKAITEGTKEYLDGETAICFMGHGTENASNHVYADMQTKLTEAGYKDYFIGTVEATPTFQEVVDAVKAAGYKKVILEPLMVVAGDHANNDMADPEDPESWYSLFAAAGIEPTVVLRGLGEFTEIQDLLVEHAKAAIAGETAAPTEDQPTRDVAASSDTIARGEVEEEGMTPVAAAALNDGTYEVTVSSSSSMFKPRNATITVADGKITATFDLSKAYTWFFMGAIEEVADADSAAFLKGTATEDGLWNYTVEIEALDEGIACSAYSQNRDKWYPELILFRADSLPEGALK